MNTDLMRHKSMLFLISLSQNKIKEIENKGVDYQLFMKTICSYSHVEVHETINEDLLSSSSQYDVVVIVGHQVNGCIEMADGSLFPMNNIASALPSTFSGYLHVAVCGSSVIFDAIKERCPYSRVRASKRTTQLELQLLIYSLLLSRTDLNKETFDQWYEYCRNCVKESQERKNPDDLTKLPNATKLGNETVYMPRVIVAGKKYPFHVFIHDRVKGEIEDDYEEIRNTIMDTPAEPVDLSEGYFFDRWITDLKIDDKIDILLDFDTDQVIIEGENQQSFVWRGHLLEAKFFVVLKENYSGNETICTVTISQNGNIVNSSCKKLIKVDHEKQKDSNEDFEFLQSWMTHRAVCVFARAIDEKWIEKTEKGFKWVGFGKENKKGQIKSRTRQLAYLCHETFCQEVNDVVPWGDIETFFGENKLSRDWGNIKDLKQSWKFKIDNFLNRIKDI